MRFFTEKDENFQVRKKRSIFIPIILLLSLLLALVTPLPYVLFRPGNPENVLKSMIKVPSEFSAIDQENFDQSGRLYMTSILVTNPDSRIFALELIRAWIRSDEIIVPRESIFPKDQDPKEIKAQEAQQMVNSQERAIYSALTYLGYKIPTKVIVTGTLKASKARKILLPGDEIVKINGAEIFTSDEIISLIRKKSVGEKITVEVNRKGQILELPAIELIQNSAGAAVGVFLKMEFAFPLDIDIAIEDVGGPSAGMIFALGIIEKLSAEDFLRGRKVAGTGSINLQGEIGAIGGIDSKLIGAGRKGATLFLAPAANCKDITQIPEGVQVLAVRSLSEAVELLRTADPAKARGC